MQEADLRLRRYNLKKQSIDLRPPNRGKAITDNLPTFQNIQVDGDLLDLNSEIQPLLDAPGTMQDKRSLFINIEIPKWSKRKKLRKYGWGITKTILKMEIGQKLFCNKVNVDRQEDLLELKKEIREYAGTLGYICGFTKIDRRFIAEARDEKFPYDTAIVLGMEMNKELLDQVPHPGDRLFDFETYVKSGQMVFKVGKFIRSKGYRCSVRIPFDGFVKYPPHAINAGLGELGANGVVITREFGPRVRWTIIGIDAEIEIDNPIDLSMAAFCDVCRRCIRVCPGKAIPEERLWWRGVLKRKINDAKCFPYFKKYDGCGICLKVCPIHRFGYEKCMDVFQQDGTILKKG